MSRHDHIKLEVTFYLRDIDFICEDKYGNCFFIYRGEKVYPNISSNELKGLIERARGGK